MDQINEDKLTIWKNLIEEKKKSKLMLKDFCKEKNITPSQYYYYHGIINTPGRNKSIRIENSKLKPIQIINSNAKSESVIRFILPNSLQCILPRDISLQEIKNIMELLISC
jgi:hypothetical protein